MIRAYTHSDLDEVLECWYFASRLAHPFLDKTFLIAERELIAQSHLQLAQTWVYDNGNRVVGFIALIDHEVGGLFVHPEFQGRGVGRALMDQAASLHPVLILNVFEENRIGRRFYNQYGFTEIGQEMHEATHQNQIRMRLDCR